MEDICGCPPKLPSIRSSASVLSHYITHPRTTTKERKPGLKHVIPDIEDVGQALVSVMNPLRLSPRDSRLPAFHPRLIHSLYPRSLWDLEDFPVVP